MKLIDAIESRHSIRKFKSKKVKWPDILEAINSAIKAPLAGNINTLRFIIVEDTQKKQQIAEATDQLWVAEADTLVVVCSDSSNIQRMYDERGKIYEHQQIGAAIQNFLLRITDLGLSSCWIGAYLDKNIKLILKIPENINVEAILPIGYADEKPRPKRKDSLQSVIFWEKWDQRKKPQHSKDPATR